MRSKLPVRKILGKESDAPPIALCRAKGPDGEPVVTGTRWFLHKNDVWRRLTYDGGICEVKLMRAWYIDPKTNERVEVERYSAWVVDRFIHAQNRAFLSGESPAQFRTLSAAKQAVADRIARGRAIRSTPT